MMFSMIYKTLQYSLQVRGYRSAPFDSFPARRGCNNSDMFCVTVTDDEFPGGVSLSQYQAAFLCSPLFQAELWLLSCLGYADPSTTTPKQLQQVAQGEKCSFGPWTSRAVEGNRNQVARQKLHRSNGKSESEKELNPAVEPPSASSSFSACQIMRCLVSGKEFCDTWWAVGSCDALDGAPELVLGTSIILPHKELQESLSPSNQSSQVVARRKEPLLIKLLYPFHRLYSRLLLANAKYQLIHQFEKWKQQGE